MKIKTSITLSEDVLRSLDKEAKKGESRSEVIDRLLRERITSAQRSSRDARDLQLINRHADELNKEAEDVLGYQEDL
jgi:metal-responsive CopG/Arc/MetJ family transcriptional regulator